MPVSVELKYEYFNTWAGRVKIVELVSVIDYFSCTCVKVFLISIIRVNIFIILTQSLFVYGALMSYF